MDCIDDRCERVVVVVKSWVGFGGAYNRKKVCTLEIVVLRDRGLNLGGVVEIHYISV